MRLEFTLDCSDLDRMAEFWQAAVGFVVDGSIEGRYVSLSGHGVTLTLQAVAEPKTVKNRIHWDVSVRSGGLAALEAVGATILRRRDEEIAWTVMADPEGNEFCAFSPPVA